MDNSFIFIIFFSAFNFAEIILGAYHYMQMKKYKDKKRIIYNDKHYKSYGILMTNEKGLYYENQFVFYNCLLNGVVGGLLFLMVISRTFTDIFWCPGVFLYQILISMVFLSLTLILKK